MGCVNPRTATTVEAVKKEPETKKETEPNEEHNNEMLKEETNKVELNPPSVKVDEKKETEVKLPSQKEEIVINNTEEEIKKEKENITQAKVTEEKKELSIEKDPQWHNSKLDFQLSCKKGMIVAEDFHCFSLAIKSIVSITKTDYADFEISQKYEINLIKENINVNWSKPPTNKIKKTIMDAFSKDNIVGKCDKINWEFRAYSQYEKYTSKVKMLKISSLNKDLEHFVLAGCDIRKPIVMLIFSFTDKESIYCLKEILSHHSSNKESYDFIPLYATILESAKTSLYIWELGEKMGLPQENLEMYFVENGTLNKMFGYISEDNMKKITCKVIVIDSNQIIRHIESPKNFTLNLIENLSVDKKEYQKCKEDIVETINRYNKESDGIPIKCDLALKRTKIYKYDKVSDSFVPDVTYYDTLSGELKTKNEKIKQDLNKVSKFVPRKDNKEIKISIKDRNNIITKEMEAFLTGVGLSDIKYQAITHKSKILLSIPSHNTDSKKQKNSSLKHKNFKMEFSLPNELFESQFQMAITAQMNVLSEYFCFGDIDYMSAIPTLGSIFPSQMILLDSESKEESHLILNEDGDKPSVIIVFSPSSKEFTSKMELSSRMKSIYKIISNYKDDINIYLICRAEVETYEDSIEYYEDDDIFNDEDLPMYLLTSSNVTFPLYYQNNGIESADSQFNVIITNHQNIIKYIGNCEDIYLKETLDSLIDEEDTITYIEKYPITYNEFKTKVGEIVDQLEEILVKLFEDADDDNKPPLLYKPYVTLSYNINNGYLDTKSSDEQYVNHIRIRILIKRKHKDAITKEAKIKDIIKSLKTYGVLVQIIPLPCVTLEIGTICKKCGKDLEETDPFYYEQSGGGCYCIECGDNLETFMSHLIYFKTLDIDDEIIEEFYSNNGSTDKAVESYLGNNCKICNSKLGNLYYVNMTHFNVLDGECPMNQIDICAECFDVINKEEKFNSNEKENNYNKLGLSAKHMIYRKIKILV